MRRRPLFVRDYTAYIEAATGIQRTVPPSFTRNDVERLTRKRLGPSWGRPRRARKTP